MLATTTYLDTPALGSLTYILLCIIGISAALLCGLLLYRLVRAFVGVRPRWGAPMLVLGLGGSTGMVIWVGDPNLLYTFPVFLAFFMLATRGDRIGRLAVCFIFFCMMMSIAALLDTYLGYTFHTYQLTDMATRLGRLLVIALIYVGFRRFLPKEPPLLSRRLWGLVLALALMPLAALASTVLLTFPRYESDDALNVAMRIGIGILPFVLLTAIVLLGAILVLARQTVLEQEQALAAQREIYYEGLRQQDASLRELRHDLRNHVTTASGLLALGKTAEARAYLDALSESTALSRPHRYCDNEAANVVLAAKADALAQVDIASDFQIQLPATLPFADTDLVALLGNALDNAREGAAGIAGATVRCRCRFDKGMLMLAVDNPTRGDVRPDLATTKADKQAHGFGLASMRNTCARYHGSLETRVDNDGFHLLACLSAGSQPS